MLEIIIPESEFLDPKTYEFVSIKRTTIQLEHSLLSISKWESKYRKAFLGDGTKNNQMSDAEFRYYVKCMTLTKNVDPNVYLGITDGIKSIIFEYIKSPMTATTFSNNNRQPNNKTITSELIYYDMIAYGVPFECQKWHLNRLLTLLRVCSIKQSKPEKMPYKDMVAQRRALNASRLRGGRRG